MIDTTSHIAILEGKVMSKMADVIERISVVESLQFAEAPAS